MKLTSLEIVVGLSTALLSAAALTAPLNAQTYGADTTVYRDRHGTVHAHTEVYETITPAERAEMKKFSRSDVEKLKDPSSHDSTCDDMLTAYDATHAGQTAHAEYGQKLDTYCHGHDGWAAHKRAADLTRQCEQWDDQKLICPYRDQMGSLEQMLGHKIGQGSKQ